MKIKLSELRRVIQGVLIEAPGRYREPFVAGKSAKGVISFPTVTALALWKGEILGQLSDGAWENSGPHGHYHFWHNMTPALGKAQTIATNYPEKDNYGLSKLIEYVGDRMLKTGQMAKASGDSDRNITHAAEYMPPTFEEFMAAKASGKWQHDFVGKYMEVITDEIAQKFYSTKYDMTDLKRDLAVIRSAMKNLKVTSDAATASPEPVEELPAPGETSVGRGPGGEKPYKIYGKKGAAPAHTRFKGKAYGAKPDTKFKSGESAYLAKTPEDKLKVKKTDDNYSQLWDPTDD